MKMKFLQCFYR